MRPVVIMDKKSGLYVGSHSQQMCQLQEIAHAFQFDSLESALESMHPLVKNCGLDLGCFDYYNSLIGTQADVTIPPEERKNLYHCPMCKFWFPIDWDCDGRACCACNGCTVHPFLKTYGWRDKTGFHPKTEADERQQDLWSSLET